MWRLSSRYAARPCAPARSIGRCSSTASFPKHGRPPLTKIVATIGPASEQAQELQGCVAAGMRVMRLNFSHATTEEVELRLKNLSASKGVNSLLGPKNNLRAILLDTKGPEIRMGGLAVCQSATGAVPSENRKAKIKMDTGDKVRLTTDPAFDGSGDASTIYVSYDRIGEVLSPGNTVLLDDGLIMMKVESIDSEGVHCKVMNANEIGERKGVNLPGVSTGLPPMSEKDKVDIAYGISFDMDFIAASFVSNAAGVHEIKRYVAECMAKQGYPADHPHPLIISKIESSEAIDNFDEILEVSDGIMVARGDLGVEIPLEEVPLMQKMMVQQCNAVGKPVIVATQMLDTMQSNPRPTRAEVSDVTNAVCDGADALMLSGESANGKFPVESIETMRSIIDAVETSDLQIQLHQLTEPEEEEGSDGSPAGFNPFEASASGAVEATRVCNAKLLICMTATGSMARLVAKYRPDVPVLCVCVADPLNPAKAAKVGRQLMLSRGCHPVLLGEDVTTAEHLAKSVGIARQLGFCDVGDNIVIVGSEAGQTSASCGSSLPTTPTVRMVRVQDTSDE